MKVRRNFVVLAVILAMVLTIVGCGQAKQDSKAVRPQQEATEDRMSLESSLPSETVTSSTPATGNPTFPRKRLPIIVKRRCNTTRWSDIKVRGYNAIQQDGQRIVIGANIYQTRLKLPTRGKNERYLAIYTKKSVDALRWQGQILDNHRCWCIGSEAPGHEWTDGEVTVFVVPKELLASEYWKEIKVRWVDLTPPKP